MATHVAGTTPYPWPYDGDLAAAATALLVVAPAGFEPSDEDAEAAADVALLAATLRAAGGVVLAATTTPLRAGRPVTVPPGPPPALALLGAQPPDLHLAAGGVDAFYGSDLELVLSTRRLTRLLLAGAGLETAVHSTMRDANDRGYECLLVVDACVPVDRSLVGPAVSMVEMSGGIFGAVGRTADVVAALEAAHPPLTLEGAHR